MSLYNCFHCSEEDRYKHVNPAKVLDHITRAHLQRSSEDNNILPKFPCLLTNCKVFRSRSSVLRHIRRPNCMHTDRAARVVVREAELEEIGNIEGENVLEGVVDENVVQVYDEENIDDVENSALNSYSKNLEFFFNFLKTKGLSEESVNEIVSHQKTLFEHVEIISKGSKNNFIYSELKKYKTAYKRKQNFKKHANFTPVKQYAINVKLSKFRRRGVVSHINKQSKFAYIHLNKTLEIVFKNKSFRKIYEDYNKNKKCNNLLMKGFCCGSVYKSSSYFQKNPNAIQIQIFYDDFLVNNPLGNKKTNQKLGGIYFSIKNLPQYFLSKQDQIFLVCLFKVKHLRENPMLFNKILLKIRLDIKYLQNTGISVDGEKMTAHLTSLSYDNLGANTICGLNRSFTANRYCRICKLTKEECKVQLTVHPSMIRTGIESKRLLLRDGDKMGLVFHSKLNDIPGFNVFDNVTVDPMHDVSEGTIPKVLRIFFDHLSNSGILSFKKITELILSYELPSLESKNKIKKINVNKDLSFGLYASQYKSLIFHIPFIFQNYIDAVDPLIWSLVAKQIKITKIVFSYKIPYRFIETLDQLFESFLQSFSDLNISFTPKLHNLTHYTMLIKKMGPVAHYSTFHYEHFHQQFIRMSKSLRCFKNLTFTLAEKYMSTFILKWSENKFVQIEQMGKINYVGNEELVEYRSILENYSNADFEELKFLNTGFLYTKDLIVVRVIDEAFEFLKIIKVLRCNNQYYLLIQRSVNLGYDNNFACYEIEFFNEYDLIKLASLNIENSYNYLKANDKYYVMNQNVIC